MRGLPVVHEGATYSADIGPGAPGEMLTADGAKPVAGMTVAVQKRDTPLGYDQGKRAKAVARAACVGQGHEFNASVLGHLAEGVWTFRGACI
ncbi:hypothetical protein [Phaeovulum sp.]|uniref:hypothetical protein n=1 Tax=Phaeovulum sp. TaxID=2934796 RepID=UPI0039E5658B